MGTQMAMKVEEAAQLVKNMREEFEEELEHVEVTLREEFVSVQVRPRRVRLRGKHELSGRSHFIRTVSFIRILRRKWSGLLGGDDIARVLGAV